MSLVSWCYVGCQWTGNRFSPRQSWCHGRVDVGRLLQRFTKNSCRRSRHFQRSDKRHLQPRRCSNHKSPFFGDLVVWINWTNSGISQIYGFVMMSFWVTPWLRVWRCTNVTVICQEVLWSREFVGWFVCSLYLVWCLNQVQVRFLSVSAQVLSICAKFHRQHLSSQGQSSRSKPPYWKSSTCNISAVV